MSIRPSTSSRKCRYVRALHRGSLAVGLFKIGAVVALLAPGRGIFLGSLWAGDSHLRQLMLVREGPIYWTSKQARLRTFVVIRI
jgi:hypothetical protein